MTQIACRTLAVSDLQVYHGAHFLLDDDRVTQRIIGVIKTLEGMTPEVLAKVTPQTNIVRDLGLDSIAVMDFVMELETAFDTVIPLDTIASIETVADLARVLERQPMQVTT